MRNRRALSDTAASMTPEAWSGVDTECCDEAITENSEKQPRPKAVHTFGPLPPGLQISASNGSIFSFLGTLFYSSVARLRQVPVSRLTGEVNSNGRGGRVQRRFSAGDRVRVAGDFFWAKGATGTVSAPPDAVTTISGPWEEGLTRREVSALGTHTVYWVWFDDPQHDADGDGPYRGGQIWESALTLLSAKPN